MVAELPAPPVPADADLRHFDDMPLEVRRLRDSGIAGVADAEAFRCGLLSWCTAWHQVPAGSLPNDDADLCRLVGLGRDLRTWRRIKPIAMRGWRLFSDGRLYHPVVTEKVIDRWNGSRLKFWANECDRIRKENKARADRKELPLEFPEKPAPIPYVWPAEGGGNSGGSSGGIPQETPKIPPENGLKGREGKGRRREGKEDHDAAAASEPLVAAREPAEPEEPPDAPANGHDPTGERVDEPAAAFAAWEAAAATNGWTPAQFLTTTRRFRLQAILAICGGLAGWMAALEIAPTAKFLHGTDGSMHRWFDIDWLLDEQHFTRLMEGRYAERHERVNGGRQPGQPDDYDPELAGIRKALAGRSVPSG